MERQQFAYNKEKEGIMITRCYGTSSRVVIPETIEGLPVTGLGAYAFAKEQEGEAENRTGFPCICGKDLEELYLPETIRTLGRYVFYNCLCFKRLSFFGTISYTGAGAFTGCERLSRLELQEVKGESSCLGEILSDLKQMVEVGVYQAGSLCCEVVYPEFYEEAEENTPARIINTVTHGMGVQYRNTFQDTRIVFREYDRLFEIGKYNMDLISGILITTARLRFPKELEKAFEKSYREYLKEHLKEAAAYFAEQERLEELRWLSGKFITEQEEAQTLLNTAVKLENPKVLGMLMDVCHERFPGKKRKFSL